MLSVVVAARAGKDSTLQCMQSILFSFQSFPDTLEYILIDDYSDPVHEIQPVFQGFRDSVQSPVKVFRARRHRHYTAGLGFALSQACGDAVLFLSNDMMVTPDYVATLLKVAAKDPSLGIIRGMAQYVDSHPEHQLCSPLPLRNYRDICGFSRFLAQYFEDYHVEDRLLCGDAMLIRRAVIQRIGVTDPRYFGYFGDIDYGLRAQRAGFRLVCAKGAWLHHTGALSLRWETDRPASQGDQAFGDRMGIVQAAYDQFRRKWDPSLPERYTRVADIDFERLRQIAVGFDLYQAPDPSWSADYEAL